VLDACQQQTGARDDIDFPKILICSQPAPFFEDRPLDQAALEAATLAGLKTLEAGGADFLAIACNTVHIYFDSLARQVEVPLLNLVELAVADLAELPGTVALVAARGTAESEIYQSALRAAGREVAAIGW
jgi:aspartate racemase